MISVFINMFKTVDDKEEFGHVQHVRLWGLTGQRNWQNAEQLRDIFCLARGGRLWREVKLSAKVMRAWANVFNHWFVSIRPRVDMRATAYTMYVCLSSTV